MYRNAADCVRKVYANEGGVRGFYRGVWPQLLGVAPEKAIKLTVNDLVRKKRTDPETGRITLGSELIAGGTAGACQVVSYSQYHEGNKLRLQVVTNPLEIVKIRLQMAGEIARSSGGAAPPRGAWHIIKSLGLVGLYKVSHPDRPRTDRAGSHSLPFQRRAILDDLFHFIRQAEERCLP